MLPELYWLTLTALMTALLWVPYILQFIIEKGLFLALSAGEGTTTPKAAWAARAKRAHANAVENLAIFAPLVLVAVMSQTTTQITALAAMVYFCARLAHYVVYTFGLPWVRTPIFAVSWACMIVIGLSILGVV